MTVTMFSNFLNHYQIPFCDEMYKILGANFVFVSTIAFPEERLSSGFKDCSNYIYNLNSYIDEKEYARAKKLGLESDIVIIGATNNDFINARIKQKKIIFRYAERFLKTGDQLLLNPRFFLAYFKKNVIKSNENIYMLCASAFTARDLNLICAYPNRKYKWGYFPEFKEYDIDKVFKQKEKKKTEIVWAARFLYWKHPELVIYLANELKLKRYNFHINMIGEGDLKESMQAKVHQLGLTDFVSLTGSVSNEKVRDIMLKSNIFLFTSDRNEGWGVVLNEAMNSGCAVVVSDAVGAVPYLIDDGVNGLIFKSQNLNHLVLRVEKLIQDFELQKKLSAAAYTTMYDIWNPNKAASNFLALAASKLNNYNLFIEKGPCSLA